MEHQTHPSSPSSPITYVTAPNSPIDLHEFEFNNLSGHLNFADDFPDDPFQTPLRHRDRGDSLPTMAFADQLFLNGQVMPLKLPPRLHESNGKSPITSPRTACRLPFARRSSTHNDFDPFMIALEKVREESRGRNSHHRRSRSYSPFRGSTTTEQSNKGTSDYDNLNQVVKILAPSYSGPLDFKGSAYARWVRDQTREGISPEISPGRFAFAKRVRPMKEHDNPDKADFPKPEKDCSIAKTKVWKLKGLLMRFGSVKKQAKPGSEGCKPSYFGRVSFKLKRKKRMVGADGNMAVVEYKPPPSSSSFTLCLGRGSVVGSPAAEPK